MQTEPNQPDDDPWSLPPVRSRLRLALSVLRQRPFCPDCQVHVDQATLALEGASITDLQDLAP